MYPHKNRELYVAMGTATRMAGCRLLFYMSFW